MAKADDSSTTRDAAMAWYKIMQKLDDVRQRYYEISPGRPKVQYGHLHGQPIMISDTESWTFMHGEWVRVHLADAAHKDGLMTEQTFKAIYNSLPPLPVTALQKQ